MMRLRPRSQPSLRKDSTKASWKRAALAGVDSDAPERMPTRAIFVVWADTGTAMPPVSKAAPSAKTNLRRFISTSAQADLALNASEHQRVCYANTTVGPAALNRRLSSQEQAQR